MKRLISSVVSLSLVSLISVAVQAQELEWRPINVDGLQYQHAQLENGLSRFRMTPAQLQATLGKFQTEAGVLAKEAARLNLSASVKRAPSAAMRLLSSVAREMGPGITFFNPPSFDHDISSFTFTDGKRFVAVNTAKADSQSLLSPMVSVKVYRRDGQKEIVERSVHFRLQKKSNETMQLERQQGRASRGTLGSPWTSAHLRVEGRGGQRWTEYTSLSKPGQWFGRKGSQREVSQLVLRSMDGAGGKAREVPVKGLTAERLYTLSSLGTYRTHLSSSHPRHGMKNGRFDDVNAGLLKEAGVQTVVDGRGRVYLRGGPRLDRAQLRADGLTFVARSRDGRRSHLRHLPTRRP